MTEGRSSRAIAMTMAGIVLSQPESVTRPSSRWPRVTSSTESAIQSRLMSEAFMPSVPIAMPSVTEIVLNSIGVPPAARTPSATFWASLRWLALHGVSSIQQCDADQRARSEEHTSELQSLAYLVCRLLLEKKKKQEQPRRRHEHVQTTHA